MSKMKSYLSDAALLMDREFGYHDNVPDNYKEYRYEERYGDYLLRCWCDGREVST